MDNKNKDLTPMVRQYLEIKKEHQDKVLFFRLGDFYEMFNEDAEEISKLLNLTLTHRGSMPMCGIPHHALKNYLKRLLDMGKKVALCEQFVNPLDSKKLANREVTQVFTPATVVDDEYLDSLSNSVISAVNINKKAIYVAWADITTGEFKVTTLLFERDFDNLSSLLYQLESKEILVNEDLYFSEKRFREIIDNSGAMITKLPSYYFTLKSGKRVVNEQFSQPALRLMEIDDKDYILTSISALLLYLKDTAKSDLPQLKYIEKVTKGSFLSLNSATIKNLEIIKNLTDNTIKNTLFSSVNRTITSYGSRFLKESLLHPLQSISEINKRLDWVEKFYKDEDETIRIRNYLSQISDLERLSVKASMKRLNPRDLISIAESTLSFLRLVEEKDEYLFFVDEANFNFSSLIEFSTKILNAINRECTNINNAGTIINDGYDNALDEIRALSEDGSSMLNLYLEKIKEETGITNIKVGDNRIIGSFLEVSKGQLDRVPSYFIRRQTLVNGERFTTEELNNIQSKILNSKEEAAKKEREIFFSFISDAYTLYDEIERMGKVVTLLDYYSSLAFLAKEKNYTRPTIIEEGEMNIVDGRHPVVEDNTDCYISNSFSSSSSRFTLLTGPNMAGKSTYLRQIALITLLSHTGSFVPCKEATIPLTDKIFCRVGAQDNLSKGESTFLVEMSESAQILLSLTNKSLVIMDEIGRGTSTQDGMSIAYAIMNYLRQTNAITLFSTHYHELTMLDNSGIQLLHMAVLEDKNNITFLRKAEKGVAQSSYGIHVAKLAGLPRSVINDANNFMKRYFADYSSFGSEEGNLFSGGESNEGGILEDIAQELENFDTDNSSPLEALFFINKLKEKLKEE